MNVLEILEAGLANVRRLEHCKEQAYWYGDVDIIACCALGAIGTRLLPIDDNADYEAHEAARIALKDALPEGVSKHYPPRYRYDKHPVAQYNDRPEVTKEDIEQLYLRAIANEKGKQ